MSFKTRFATLDEAYNDSYYNNDNRTMLEKIQDTEIVLGVRKLREEKLYLRLFRQAFYRINNLFTDSKTPIGAGEFMLITKITLVIIMRF